MSFFNELKRRNVIRVGIAYVIVAWLIMQFSDVVLNNISAPGWVFQVIMLVLGISFPVVLIMAWAFEVTPDGIKKEKDVDRSQSVTSHTGRKLDFTIIAVLVLAVAYFVFDEYQDQTVEQAAAPQTTASTAADSAATEPKPTPIVVDPSIAVLPFADMSPEQDQGYFSDGISEELLNLLVRVEGLKVASRTSSFTYKGSNQSLAEIASELKVDHVLEGSVRKADNRIRITAQLIDAKTDRHLWSDSFDRELVDIFAVQDEIANAIVEAMKSQLGVLTNASAVSAAVVTENLDAYESYLKARSLFIARERLEESMALFERSIELDPEFARAWESLAAVYSVVESWGITGRDYEALSIEAAQRSLELDPGLSMPWAVMGTMSAESVGDYLTGMEYHNKAVENDPLNTTALLWRGISWNNLGMFDKAIADIGRCLEIDPFYHNCRRHLAVAHLAKGEEDLALQLFQESAEQGFFGSELVFSPVLIRRGDRLAAVLNFWRWETDRSFPASALMDAIEFPERDHGAGLAKYLNWLETSGTSSTRGLGDLGLEFALFGAYDRVVISKFNNGWMWIDGLEGFRKSPQFKPFLIDTGIPAYWREHGYPQQCRPLGEDDFECD